MPASSRLELTSWKEIAAYLGVSVKTAQLWERDRAMPVRRLPGGRGRVWADAAELDAWKNQQPAVPTARRWAWPWALAAAMVLVVPALGLLWLRPASAPPDSITAEQDGFTIFDAAHTW